MGKQKVPGSIPGEGIFSRIIEILEGLIGHSKARLSSLMISGNNLTDEFTKWLSREVGENSNDDIFTAVKEVVGRGIRSRDLRDESRVLCRLICRIII